jgi:prolyl oligopeptidase
MSSTPLGSYKAFYHRLGSPQSADTLVLAGAPNSNEFPATRVTADGAYALLLTGALDANGYGWFTPNRPGSAVHTLVEPGDGPVRYVGNRGSRFFFRLSSKTSNGRIASVDAADPAHALHTVVPGRRDALVAASIVGDRIYLDYLHDVHNVLDSVDVNGRRERGIALPGLGTASVPFADGVDQPLRYTFESFTQPSTTYALDPRTGRSTVAERSPIRFDAGPFVTEQFFATSKDGTRVPVFVTRRRDVPYDGSTPTILYGYGGFGNLYTVTPNFGFITTLWLQMGGTYAVVNARGGGEYGEAWHRAGMLANKQHVFDDVVAAAELLIARKLTSPPKLALRGGSEGGLMAAAVAMQRPDLFGAVLRRPVCRTCCASNVSRRLPAVQQRPARAISQKRRSVPFLHIRRCTTCVTARAIRD